MLLSREFLISSLRKLQPTYDSLNVLSEYILLFDDDTDSIIEVLHTEAQNSNAYSVLFMVYLLNELIKKNPKGIKYKEIGLEVLKIGKKKVAELEKTGNSTFSKSAPALKRKYLDIQALWAAMEKEAQEKQEPSLEPNAVNTTNINNIINGVHEAKTNDILNAVSESKTSTDNSNLDITYLQSLCQQKNEKELISYIKKISKYL
ncbi:hypothetical protein NEOKW01_0487 [Nematocida sp. AWRm80]|nr:hypothetical protein NEOKW01_0487 [Nematocida sp. AWRm80]